MLAHQSTLITHIHYPWICLLSSLQVLLVAIPTLFFGHTLGHTYMSHIHNTYIKKKTITHSKLSTARALNISELRKYGYKFYKSRARWRGAVRIYINAWSLVILCMVRKCNNTRAVKRLLSKLEGTHSHKVGELLKVYRLRWQLVA